MRNLKMENFLNFRNCLYRRYLAQMYLLFSEIVTVMINWQQDFLSSNSVCNHTRDWQIRLPLGGRPILLITRMITDRIGLYLVPLPLFTAWVGKRVLLQYLDIDARKLHFVWITFSPAVPSTTKGDFSSFRTTLKRQIWFDYGNHNSWLPFTRN